MLLAAPLGAKAQPEGQAPRAGVLGPGSTAEMLKVRREPFERGLRQLGWAPGVNGVLEYRRYGDGSAAQPRALAIELVGE